MKIVQISSLWERTPPPKYGGLELVVSNLTEELVKQGHQVTLFATGDSKSKAKLKSVYPRPLYRDGLPWTAMHDIQAHLAEAIKYAHEWGADIIHNHLSHRSFALMSLSSVPFVNTVHGTVDQTVLPADWRRAFTRYKTQPFISISYFQRKHAPELSWVANAYNGIDTNIFPFEAKPRADYLLWVGRFSEKKAPHLAMNIAEKLGVKLLMAAKLDMQAPADLKYFEEMIKPRLQRGKFEWVGEVGHKEKVKLYKNALALLNPIIWDDPFGLVVTESMACGTPVIAFRRGSMGEIIIDGETGFLVNPGDENGFVNAVEKVGTIDRTKCRTRVEELFSVSAMTKSYLEAYSQRIAQ